MASAILVLESRSVSIVIVMAIAIRAFCRAYYFAFYAIEKYVDPNFRYAGLLSLSRYAFKKLIGRATEEQSIVTASAPQRDKKTWSDVYIEMTKWFLIAAIGNFLVPIIFCVWTSEEFSLLRFNLQCNQRIVDYLVSLTTAELDYSNSGNDAKSTDQQFSIRYLLIGMTTIAICLAVSKAIGLKSIDFLEPALLIIILSGIITLAFIAIISMLCFEITLRSPQGNAYFKAIALLASYLCFPSLIIVILRSIPSPLPGSRWNLGSVSTHSLPATSECCCGCALASERAA